MRDELRPRAPDDGVRALRANGPAAAVGGVQTAAEELGDVADLVTDLALALEDVMGTHLRAPALRAAVLPPPTRTEADPALPAVVAADSARVVALAALPAAAAAVGARNVGGAAADGGEGVGGVEWQRILEREVDDLDGGSGRGRRQRGLVCSAQPRVEGALQHRDGGGRRRRLRIGK